MKEINEYVAFDMGVSDDVSGNLLTIVLVGEESASYLAVSPDRALELADLIIDRANYVIRQKRADLEKVRFRHKSATRIIAEEIKNYQIGQRFTARDIAISLGFNPGAISNILGRNPNVKRVGVVSNNKLRGNRHYVFEYERVA